MLVLVCAVSVYNLLTKDMSPDIDIEAAYMQPEASGPAGGGKIDVGTKTADAETNPDANDAETGAGAVSDAVAEDDRQAAQDFTMLDWEGEEVTLSGLLANGKPVVLNFWASWCPPCKGEMPEFEAAYKEFGDEVQFVMADTVDGQRETVEIGKQYILDQGYTFPVFFDADQEGAYAYGIRYIPTTLFIDKDGYIIAGAQSALDGETLRKGIEMIK